MQNLSLVICGTSRQELWIPPYNMPENRLDFSCGLGPQQLGLSDAINAKAGSKPSFMLPNREDLMTSEILVRRKVRAMN
jgi:hypothetical protein